MNKVQVDFSINMDTHFNTIKTMRFVSLGEIPLPLDIVTFSDVSGIYEVVERIFHYENNELFSVRVIVKSTNKY